MDPAREWTRTHIPALDGRWVLVTSAESGVGVGVDPADPTSVREAPARWRTAHAGAL